MPKKPAKKAPAKKPAARKPRAKKTPYTIAVDFPAGGDRITGSYTFRISAPAGSEVEVSLDGGPWRACRESVGFYWFDWQSDGPGVRVLAARGRLGDGDWTFAPIRRFEAV